jgi:two-component system chemotaxis response regulator CheY
MSNLKVLTIDDSRTMRDMLKAALVPNGFDVWQASDGLEGLELMRRKAFDVVITDINMPVMDGLTFLSRVRSCEDYIGLPVLVLTTENTQEKKEAGKKVGATGWIVKPFEPDALIRAIRRVCH